MVYIRAKKVKKDQYLYLVKSVWDSKKNTSKQQIVKYLGKASEVIKEDIPLEFRNNAKILSVLSTHNPKDIRKREDVVNKAKQQLFKKLTEGNLEESIKIYKNYVEIFNISNFFDKILRPVMIKIGKDWKRGKISIATEFIKIKKPNVVLISITIQDNILAGQRLVKKIRKQNKIPILIGGHAIQREDHPKFEGKVVGDVSLEDIPKILRKIHLEIQ